MTMMPTLFACTMAVVLAPGPRAPGSAPPAAGASPAGDVSPAATAAPTSTDSPVAAGDVGASDAVRDSDANQDPEAIARAADAALESLRSLGAEFNQEVVNPILERTSTGRGTLLYKAPDRFRIAYSDPAGDVVVNDGDHVWIFLPSSQPGQVIRQPSDESGVQNPLTYLRDLRRHFEATHAGRERILGHPADHLAMTPRTERAPFARLDVWVDASTKLPRQVRTTTADDVVTTYTFKTFQRNVTLADRLFTFSAPPGVEVFDQ